MSRASTRRVVPMPTSAVAVGAAPQAKTPAEALKEANEVKDPPDDPGCAALASPHPIDSAPVTEILYTGGEVRAALRPPRFEPTTACTAAIATRAAALEVAPQPVHLLTGPDTAAPRESGGIEAPTGDRR